MMVMICMARKRKEAHEVTWDDVFVARGYGVLPRQSECLLVAHPNYRSYPLRGSC